MSELNNNGRADFAAAALATYHSETRYFPDTYGDEDSEQFAETFSDLLGDLQHLARRAGADFAEMLERGTDHFQTEVGEEEELARQEAERIRLKNAPIDEQVYAAVSEGFEFFAAFRQSTGIEVSELRRSLLRLQDQSKVEQVYGKGWRRVPAAGGQD